LRGHVDTETLAEYREDLLPRRAANRVAAHLRECAQCTRLDAQLAGVGAALARSPAPPMPDALTARITAALAAEAAARQAGQASPQAASGVPATVRPVTAGHPGNGARGGTRGRKHARDARWRGFGLRAATATAVAVVVIGGGYGVLTLLNSGGQAGPATSGGTRQPAGGGVVQPGFQNRGPAAAPADGLLPVVHSGTSYHPGHLGAQVSTVLARSAPSASSWPAANGHAGSFGAFRQLPVCVSTVTKGSQPRLVDIARYRGQQAAVIVAAIPGTRELNVWVVGTGCSRSNTDILQHTMVTTVP
jgi:hypothetical protein